MKLLLKSDECTCNALLSCAVKFLNQPIGMRICEYNNSDGIILSRLLFCWMKSEYLVSLLVL